MDKKVILVYPKTGWDTLHVTVSLPLSVLFVAAPLRANGYPVVILDQRVEKDCDAALRRELASGDVLVVGFSSMTGIQITHALRMSRIVKEAPGDVPTCWGGIHPTIVAQQTIDNRYVDFTVSNDGEDAFLELCEALRTGASTENIPGVGFKRRGIGVPPRPRPFVDMNRIPDLPYDLIDVNQYITSAVKGHRDLVAATSRGCPYQCTYCYVGPSDQRWRSMEPARMLHEVRRLMAWPITAVNFLDDLFFVQPRRIAEFCDLVTREGIDMKFRADARIDQVLRVDEADWRRFAEAGFTQLYIGVESGSNRILKFVKKGITRDQVLLANQKLRKVGISPKYSFMAGYPGETMRDVQETLDLMVRLVEENEDAGTTNLQLYSPYPGTELFDFCREQGFREPDKLEDWAGSNWNRIDYGWLTKKERRFLERASYFTYFLDGRTVADWYSHRPILSRLLRFYGKVSRFRAKRSFFAFFPEAGLIKMAKERAFQ